MTMLFFFGDLRCLAVFVRN